MAKGTTEDSKPDNMVSQEEFKGFQEKVDKGFGAILEKLEAIAVAPTVPVAPAKIEGGPDEETPIPPAWKQLVRDILGEDFDCELKLPEAGGSIFKIIVPKDKSNASQMHWTMFKRDVRSKELGNTGVKGVKEHCLLVRKNLLASGTKLPVYP